MNNIIAESNRKPRLNQHKGAERSEAAPPARSGSARLVWQTSNKLDNGDHWPTRWSIGAALRPCVCTVALLNVEIRREWTTAERYESSTEVSKKSGLVQMLHWPATHAAC